MLTGSVFFWKKKRRASVAGCEEESQCQTESVRRREKSKCASPQFPLEGVAVGMAFEVAVVVECMRSCALPSLRLQTTRI